MQKTKIIKLSLLKSVTSVMMKMAITDINLPLDTFAAARATLEDAKR